MPSPWLRILAIALGGALGANARYWLGLAITRWLGPGWPWGTFLINVTGSFAIGVLAAWLAHQHPHSSTRLLLIAGFLGSYTTFSTFSLDALTLLQRGRGASSAGYLAASVGAGLLAAWLGVALVDRLDARPLPAAPVPARDSSPEPPDVP
jgi:CrcB protein